MGALAVEKEKHLHAQFRKQGFQADVFVVNSNLVDMHANYGVAAWRNLGECLKHLVTKMYVITWNAMIAGYPQQGMGQEALSLHSALMQAEGISVPHSVTLVYPS